MVWGGIARNNKRNLITVPGTLTAAKYCAQIVQLVIMPYMQQYPGIVNQQGNTRPCTPRLTMGIFNNHNIQLLDWSARSPDLSPTEHGWDILGWKIQERQNVNNLNDLDQALHREWINIPMESINKLVSSMRR